MIKVNPYKTLIYLLIIYMFSTLTYRLWIVSSPNKIIGFLIFCNVVWLYYKRMTLEKMVVLLYSLIPVVWSMLQSSDMFLHMSDGIYLLITIFLLMELTDDYFICKILEESEKNKNFILKIVMLCNFILCIGFFDFKCYDSSQWDGSYYIGYANSSHTLASGACLLLVYSLYVIKSKKNIISFLFLIPSIVAILKSGARTFLIPVIVVCLIFYVYHIKKKILKLLILPGAVVTVIYVFLNSSMIKKFTFSINNQFTDMNFMGRFTNGRTVFWVVDLLAFKEYNFFQKMLGNGFDYVYIINKENFGLAIWAHNDIINSLLSSGIIATCVYIYVVFMVCRNIINNKNIFIEVLLVTYIVIPALLNGFYTYQHYVYSFFILIILYKKYYNQK